MAKRGDGVPKVEMVRAAIDELGWQAGLDDYIAYIKKTFNTDMSKAHISQTKSAERRRRGVRAARRKKGEPAAAVGESNGSASIADILAFVDTVKIWEAKIGAAGIREVVKTVLKK